MNPGMRAELLVLPGEFYVGRGPVVVRTLLGSCVAVVLWDAQQRVGGLCHFLLPPRQRPAGVPRDGSYADEAVGMMVQMLQHAGGRIGHCSAWLIGGARSLCGGRPDTPLFDVGARNIAAARRELQRLGLQPLAEDLGGIAPRTVWLDLAHGRVRWQRGGAQLVAMPKRAPPRVIVMGLSTGGVQALAQVLDDLRGCQAHLPGMVVVQHMPEGHTAGLAGWLDRPGTVWRVREAHDGDEVSPGGVLIAPAGRQTRLAAAGTGGWRLTISREQPVNHHQPSVDVLFHSAARQVGAQAVGVLMTGMGSDGAQGLLALRRAGARTAVQDEASSAVYGMPGAAWRLGAAEVQLPLDAVAGWLADCCTGPLSPPAQSGCRDAAASA